MLSIINSQASLLTFKSPQVTEQLNWTELKLLNFPKIKISLHQQSYSSVQLLSRVQLFATPWTAAHQASLSITSSWSSHNSCPVSQWCHSTSFNLILCRPLLLLPSIFPSIGVFSNESALHIRWPKYWSFSFSISPSNQHSDWSPLGWTG